MSQHLHESTRLRNCHENGESAYEKSTTYEQIAIFMLRGMPEAHDACCEIAIIFRTPEGDCSHHVAPLVRGRSALAHPALATAARVQITTDRYYTYQPSVPDAFGLDCRLRPTQAVWRLRAARRSREGLPKPKRRGYLQGSFWESRSAPHFHIFCRVAEPNDEDAHAEIYAIDRCFQQETG
jgi:hypothetical protein